MQIWGGRLNKPVRLVQLSDLHLSSSVTPEMIRHAFQLAIEEKPDLICLTGDYVTRVHGQDLSGYADLFRELSSRFPCFAVKGNHDGGFWAQYYLNDPADKQIDQILAAAKIRHFINESEVFSLRDVAMNLVGVGDLWSENVIATSAFRKSEANLPSIVLAHNPDSKELLADHDWQLMLSGHTHGAQNGLPYLHTRYSPIEDKRFTAGLNFWPERKRWIHTNVGVGNLIGFRFLQRPEVSVLELS